MTRYIDENGFILSELPPEKIINKQSKKIGKINSNTKSRLYEPCKFCNSNIKPSRMHKHLNLVHKVMFTEVEEGSEKKIPSEINPSQIIEEKKTRKRIQIVRCTICKEIFQTDTEYLAHLNTHYSNPKTTNLIINEFGRIECPACNAQVKPKGINKHLRKVHNIFSNADKIKLFSSTRNKQVVSGKDKNHEKQHPKSSQEIIKNIRDVVPESYIQDQSEKRDGSKGLGHMRREWDGKFGSYPLHDDYGDESDSN